MHPFQNEKTWTGGSFEALFYLGEQNEIQFLEKLWFELGFDGPYTNNKEIPTQQEKLHSLQHKEVVNLYGAGLIDGKVAACSSTLIIDEDGTWIYFGFPLGGLSEIYDVGAYPFDDGKLHNWTVELSSYFRELAKKLFVAVPFGGVIIGWLTIIQVDELLDAIKSGVPEERWFWYLINENGELTWYPQNKYEPLMTIQP